MKRQQLALCAMTLLVAAACSRKPNDEARAEQPARPAAGSPIAADPAARAGGGTVAGGRANSGGDAGGRRGMSVTLAASDVAVVSRSPIERGISITGELRPIERVEIRARLEGDLTGVYAREGQRVAAGALLARFESIDEASDKQSAEAERASARSSLSTAQWNLDQSRELFKEGAIPERDLRAAEQQVASARAQVAAADARVRSATSAFNDTRVTAPVSGVIETRSVAPGEHLSRGGALFTLVRNDILELAASVPAAQANDLKVGQTIRFSAANRMVIGRVARISPTVDPQSRSVTVYVQIPNRDGSLRGGTFATGRLVLSTDHAAIAIPTAAIRFSADSGEPYVYRIVAGALENSPVRLGYTDESTGVVEVLAGLNVGDKIVVGNVGTLGRGMKVQIVGGETGRRGAGR
ncbi:MAG TPA: efflux RND transporter periplasmic adaptor subunit [Longimicrobiales bacterium]